MADPRQPEDPQAGEDPFGRTVGEKEQRRARARRNRDRSTWFWLGMMGLVGWSVAVPTLIGVAIGAWLDRVSQTRQSWTLMGLAVGVLIGVISAWFWVKRESRKED